MFAPFLPSDGLTVKDFATREVEPLDKEVEQVCVSMCVCTCERVCAHGCVRMSEDCERGTRIGERYTFTHTRMCVCVYACTCLELLSPLSYTHTHT